MSDDTVSTQQHSADAHTAVACCTPTAVMRSRNEAGMFHHQHAHPFSLQGCCPPLLTSSFRLQFVDIVADMTCTLTAVCCFWQYSGCMKETAIIQHFR